ncbi:MAG TPA: ATP-binding protein [Caulobacteraceae bacterium]|nr:ATP-binding protein [Caulobacteraceae bacterium]
MAFRSVISAAGALVVIFLAGVGGWAAFQAGYWASMTICCIAAGWAGTRMLLRLHRASRLDGAGDDRWVTALLAREREARTLGAFLDHAPVPLLALNADGTLSALNLSARRFFSTDAVVVDAPAALLEAVRHASPGVRQTLSLELAGSPRAYALTTAELVSDERSSRIVALVDIQSEIQAAEATALRELIQVLSHEIMNSLTPVTSLAQTAVDLLETDAVTEASLVQAREATRSVARRSEGLLRFIDAYRELARLPPPRFAEVSLPALLAEVGLLFESRWGPAGVRLVSEPAPDVAASLDRDLMAQALLNVLANAAEAAIEAGAAPRVGLRAERTRLGGVVLVIEDNGAGVNLADPSAIFRPFFTTKPHGTGVGLSLARQVVLAHGGEIAVERTGPGGTTISTTL